MIGCELVLDDCGEELRKQDLAVDWTPQGLRIIL